MSKCRIEGGRSCINNSAGLSSCTQAISLSRHILSGTKVNKNCFGAKESAYSTTWEFRQERVVELGQDAAKKGHSREQQRSTHDGVGCQASIAESLMSSSDNCSALERREEKNNEFEKETGLFLVAQEGFPRECSTGE